MEREHTYIAIDLKSFYASAECIDRGLDPLKTNLVVADPERTEKTICLAVSPSLKAYGVPGRARLFEVIEKAAQINAYRKRQAPGGEFKGESFNDPDIKKDPALALSYIVAPPRMSRYMEVSSKIHQVYLKYIAPEDISVYSIDEVFMDVTGYLGIYRLTPRELAMKMVLDVLSTTGITATAGIGTNLYLSKVAMDVMAKHIPADKNGVRIAELDEMSYRRNLWAHRPITDFWRVGRGYAASLSKLGLYTMGDVALYSVSRYGEDRLYRQFGVNAELLIDHAWGWEPCTMADIKAYKPESNSLSSGQVLKEPYDYDRARLIVKEMSELLSLDLVEKCLVTGQVVLTIGYDIENLKDKERSLAYRGEVTNDHYGRRVPKHAHGTANIKRFTSSSRLITEAVLGLYDRLVNKDLLIRRINITAAGVINEELQAAKDEADYEQLELFTDFDSLTRERADIDAALMKEKRMQKAAVEIRKKFGKNAILKGMNLCEGGTAIERNGQIGGHKA